MKLKIKELSKYLINYTSIKFSDSLKNYNVILDIGCGEGEFISRLAYQYPKKKFIGIEIKYGRILKSLKKARALNLSNLGFVISDATIFIDKALPDKSINKIFINNPDPRPKDKHHKNRLLNSDFIRMLHRKLKRKGNVYIKTDDIDYFKYIKVNVKNSNFTKDDNKSYIDLFLPSTKFQEFYKKNNKPIYSMKLLKK